MDIFFPYGQAILPLKVSGRKPEDNGCIYGRDYEWKNILRVYIRKSIRIRLDLQNRHFSRWDIGFAIQKAAANMTAAFCRFDRLNHGLQNSVHDNRKFAKRAGCCLHGGHMGYVVSNNRSCQSFSLFTFRTVMESFSVRLLHRKGAYLSYA